VLVLVHALDDAFLHRQPGVGLGQHALAAAITVGAGVAGTVAFPSPRPGLRAALALFHTAAIRDSAEEYERRVVAFFDRSLDRN
jgi:hypothetical protein